jgi:NAD(P)-dependent dehydrogenase (short-subunit alcohol dehydrogenase family)
MPAPATHRTTSIADRFSLAGKVAIVTGGAGGIGRAIAQAFVQAGARVALADVDLSRAAVVAGEIGDAGVATVFAVDVTCEDEIERGFAWVIDTFGRIDVLVNCAGIARREPAVSHSLEKWNEVLAVNATGTFLCCRAAAKRMLATGGGAIVNIASIMGLSGGGLYPNISYQTSKGAVVNMTRALALEWAKGGIRVNAIAPTYVRTDFIKPLVESPELRARIEAMTPLGRIAEPDDIVGAALFLASSASAMVTGHVLAVDGGFLAQ